MVEHLIATERLKLTGDMDKLVQAKVVEHLIATERLKLVTKGKPTEDDYLVVEHLIATERLKLLNWYAGATPYLLW